MRGGGEEGDRGTDGLCVCDGDRMDQLMILMGRARTVRLLLEEGGDQGDSLQWCVHLQGLGTLGSEGSGPALGTSDLMAPSRLKVQLTLCHQGLSWGWR